MNYEPGTVLSFGDMDAGTYEQVTVVTAGWAYLTVLESKPYREAMILQDWLILNKGRELTVVQQEAPKPSYKPRTLIRWFGKAARRTAVVLDEGAILQIKIVDGKHTKRDHTFFTSHEEWASTFPETGGDTSYYEP